MQGISGPRRVLVTGVSGWLGQFLHRALVEALPSAEVFGTFCSRPPEWLSEERRLRVDLRDAEGVKAIVAALRPDAIVHLAALSSPGACERDECGGESVNCPTALVDAVAALIPDCRFVFTSTDLVYDGEHPPYAPSAPSALTTPGNAYGRSKLSGEQQVLRLRDSVVLRLSNVIGPAFVYQPCGTKFLEWLYRACLRREYCGLRFDEHRSFVFVEDVVRIIMRLVRGDLSRSDLEDHRVLNVGGPRGLSRLDLGVLVAAAVVGAEGAESIIIGARVNS